MAKIRKNRYFARMEIRGGDLCIKPGKPIPDGLYNQAKLDKMVLNGVIQCIDSAPPPIPVISNEEITINRDEKKQAYPFALLPAGKAVSPEEIEGLDIDALNEQAITAGWDGDRFTDTLAARDYLSKNFKG
jgi:hypothetical protein